MAHSEDIWETEVAIIRLGDLAGIDGLGEHHEHADLNEIAYEFTNEILSSEIQPRPGTPDGGEGYYLSHIAIAASLLLHLSLTAALLNFEMLGSFTTETPTVVEVRFVADNPLRNTNNEESIPEEELSLEALVQESEVLATAEALLTEVDEVLTPVEEPLENERTDVSNPTIIPQSEQDANEVQALESPAIVHSVVLPFSSSIANILESIESERSSRFYSYDCNRLEEEIGIRECKPSDDNNYQALQINPVYNVLNPNRQLDHTRDSIGVLTSQSAELALRLSSAGIPDGLADSVMEQLEVTITFYSTTANRGVENIRKMRMKSDSAQRADAIFSDPWVVLQYQKKGSR